MHNIEVSYIIHMCRCEGCHHKAQGYNLFCSSFLGQLVCHKLIFATYTNCLLTFFFTLSTAVSFLSLILQALNSSPYDLYCSFCLVSDVVLPLVSISSGPVRNSLSLSFIPSSTTSIH